MKASRSESGSLWQRLPGVAFRFAQQPPFAFELMGGDLRKVTERSLAELGQDPSGLLALLHDDDRELLAPVFEPGFAKEDELFTSVRVRSPEEGHRWCLVYAVPILGQRGEGFAVELLILPLPPGWQRLRGAFHDLNNVLMALELNITGLARAVPRDELARVWIDDLREAAMRAIELVRSSLRRPSGEATPEAEQKHDPRPRRGQRGQARLS